MKFLRLLVLLFALPLFAQQGGMWVPSLLKGMNEKEMKRLGMKISADDIYNLNHSSMKDAVPHFNGGCTSEVISDQGLLLTNHHCGYGQIQSHSTLANDYLQDGFWAYSKDQELANPNLNVTFVVKIEDVTNQVLNGVAALKTEAQKQAKIQENIASIEKTFSKEDWQENRIRTFFDGNQYLLFVTETFNDVRLVGAPPSSIGKFGSDTDNWVWPRHTGDFALFRIYADKNNRPAAYSKDNVPYKPKHYFPININGVKPNDFSMVVGYPGRTQEYLPSFAVEQIVEVLNPAKIEIRDAALKVTDSYMRKDQQIKIQYASKFASIANYWKKWIGESQGLKKSNAVGAKQNFEKNFTDKVNKAGKQAEYGDILNEFEVTYKEIEPYALAKDVHSEIFLRNVEALTLAYRLQQLENAYLTNGEQAFTDRKNNLLASSDNFYKNFNAEVDEKVFEQLIAIFSEKYPEQFLPTSLKNVDAAALTKELYGTTALTNQKQLTELLNGDAQTVIKRLNNDKLYSLAKQVNTDFATNVAPKYNELNLKNTGLQREYMKGILEFSTPEDRIFPDANSTLRVTYGKVNGYKPKDAVTYDHVTYLDGMMEKYVPGDYEFDVPEKLIELYNNKDFGAYADKNGKLPVNYIATNHTTGGNSGSPAFDKYGNLVGLNFDRVWEGTMSDIYYDPAICRNIMVDIRFVLFVVDKYAGAQNIIDELKIVNKK
ncbi:S46 family peptidase [Flavobacterium agricola]|uniref:Dipeptidyl-peptidase n=1 Tax=Flavobacterium agricola TaxID=2870839 RepID=A0ABY6LYR6_9FLAO|nr:S46 family peptidase [Flavobacterium agricola]UYW00687.1 S46 family peptidase [Flavobacterium agricola]